MHCRIMHGTLPGKSIAAHDYTASYMHVNRGYWRPLYAANRNTILHAFVYNYTAKYYVLYFRVNVQIIWLYKRDLYIPDMLLY